MRPSRCLTLPFVLLLSPFLFIILAADATDVATLPAPDGGAWLLLIVIGVIVIAITAGILVYSFRLVKAFGESTSSLIDALRALTPMPVVTISDEIPDGVDGQLEMRISSFSSLPIEKVTVILAPPPGLTLHNDHITLSRLDAGETKIFPIVHGPAPKGKYPVGITVLYCVRDEERIQEFTRTVCAGIPAELKPID